MQIPGRFYSLDVIRGLAALSVVFWHWQHFFYEGTIRPAISEVNQPLHAVFFLFYEKGWIAVDFFFALSGFIFFWLYAKDIVTREVGGWSFFVLRFSRLYPLHIVTFLLVYAGQEYMLEATGEYFVYPANDAYHAILNVFMAPGWGLEQGWSFNAPVWSVSIEVLLYAIFFLACIFFRARLAVMCALVLAGIVLLELHPPLGRGVFSFFVGGIVFRMYEYFVRRNAVKLAAWPVSVIATLMWIAVIFEVTLGWMSASLLFLANVLPDGLRGVGGVVASRLPLFTVISVVIPATILALALQETRRKTLGRRFALVGNLSYSSYLLHFPLQILFISVTTSIGISRDFYNTPVALTVFFAALIGLSLVSYEFLERPAQRLIRGRLLKKRATTSVAEIPAEP